MVSVEYLLLKYYYTRFFLKKWHLWLPNINYEEFHNYLNNPIINYKEGKNRSFTYKVIKEGFYPPSAILSYTIRGNKYKIPDKYIVETTWGKSKTRQTLRCTINYIQNKPIFRAYYGEKFDKFFESKSSCTDVATQYQKVR